LLGEASPYLPDRCRLLVCSPSVYCGLLEVPASLTALAFRLRSLFTEATPFLFCLASQGSSISRSSVPFAISPCLVMAGQPCFTVLKCIPTFSVYIIIKLMSIGFGVIFRVLDKIYFPNLNQVSVYQSQDRVIVKYCPVLINPQIWTTERATNTFYRSLG